ncbi:uncharacterized protein YALI1_A08653g [Yarrowia lipolytica]|uniref:Uncharacterized protein n=1 Tax=Yarrowia lipolytica TaxID=4952 RepID=A0A1D8N484_YARLL|nr:hypothetical protein YALI1_A08653g [Yarrowia lipolytica]
MMGRVRGLRRSSNASVSNCHKVSKSINLGTNITLKVPHVSPANLSDLHLEVQKKKVINHHGQQTRSCRNSASWKTTTTFGTSIRPGVFKWLVGRESPM